MKKFKMKCKKFFVVLCAFLTALANFQMPTVNAQSFYTPQIIGVISDAGARLRITPPSGIWSEAYWMGGIDKIAVEGNVAFCIEPLTLGTGGTYSKYDNIDPSLKVKLSRIVYYGWDTTAKTNDDYATTQYMIWEALGAEIRQWYGSFGNRYASKKATVQSKINNHTKVPKFSSDTHTVKVGETLTLTDTNNILSNFHISDDGGSNAKISGNQLIINPDSNTPENVTIKLQKVLDKHCGNSIAYRSSADDGQDVAVFRVSDPIRVTLNVNVEKEGSLKITKQDTEGKQIPNTQFTVSYHSDMSNPIGTYTTGNDGSITIDGLQPQTVYIQEVNVPEPLILDSSVKNVTIVPNKIITFTATNKIQQGQIKITKKDNETGSVAQGDASLIGAEYDVYDSSKTKIVDHLVYGSKNTTKTLPLETYYLKETKAPEGYVLNPDFIKVKLEYAGQNKSESTENITVKDDVIKGKIAINKTVDHIVKTNRDATTAKIAKNKKLPGKNFMFEVIHDATGKVVDTITTDENGVAESIELPYGHYTIHEKEKTGYSTVDPIQVYIQENDKTYTYDVHNDVLKTKLTIVKKDADTGKTIPVSKVGFKLKKDDGTYLVHSETKQDTFYTDASGTVTLPEELIYGETYTIYEVSGSVPEKYLLSLEGKEITVFGESSIAVEMYNKAVKGEIEIKKIGEVLSSITGEKGNYNFIYENKPLADASFQIIAAEDIKAEDRVSDDYYKAGDVIATLTTNTNGIATLENLPLGKYLIKEINAPNGMILNNEIKEVELKYEGESTAVVFASTTIQNNRQHVDIDIKKTDSETSETLKGSQFTLYAKQDIVAKDGSSIKAGEQIRTVVTDKDGKANMGNDLPLSTYYMQETKAPSGYATNTTKYDIDANYKDPNKTTLHFQYKIKNDITKVAFSKFDLTTGKELPGAKLKVYEKETGEIIDEWISEEEPHIIKGLEPQKTYVMEEIMAPEGYVTAESIEFIVKDSADIQKVEMKDDHTRVEVIKIDSNTHKPVIGTQLSIFPLDQEGNPKDTSIKSWITEETPYLIEYLPIGEYILKETLSEEAIKQGYVSAEDIYFTVKDIANVQKVEMKDDYTKVEFTKEDTNGNTVTGATLTLIPLDKEGNLKEEEAFDTWISKDEAHTITYLPIGKYVLRELSAPEGFVKATDMEIEVKDTNKTQKFSMIDKKVSFTKFDVTGKKEIIGAEMEVQDEEGNIVDSWTSSEEVHFISGLEEGKTYTLIEKLAPEDYVKAESIEFCVTEEKIDQKIEMKDKQVNVSKLDVNGAFLEGATLQIVDTKTKQIVDEWTTTNNTHYTSNLIEGHTYLLKEIKTPVGYATAKDIEFTVSNEKENQTIEMFNKQVIIHKVDKEDDGDYVEGATLSVYEMNKDGNVLEDKPIDSWITDKKEHIVQNLEVGKTYVLREEHAPKGYEKAKDQTFTVLDNQENQEFKMIDTLIPISVETGDFSNAGLWISLSLISGMFALFGLLKLKKKKNL